MIKWIIIFYVGYFLFNILKDMFFEERLVKEKNEDIYFIEDEEESVIVKKEDLLKKGSDNINPISITEEEAERQFQEVQDPDDYAKEMKAENEIERREELFENAKAELNVKPIKKEENYVEEEAQKTIQTQSVLDLSKKAIQKTVNDFKEIMVLEEENHISNLLNQLPS